MHIGVVQHISQLRQTRFDSWDLHWSGLPVDVIARAVYSSVAEGRCAAVQSPGSSDLSR